MWVVIFPCASTEEQAEEGHSIDAQIRIAHKGWTVGGEYAEILQETRAQVAPTLMVPFIVV